MTKRESELQENSFEKFIVRVAEFSNSEKMAELFGLIVVIGIVAAFLFFVMSSSPQAVKSNFNMQRFNKICI
jgi:hypothetical protein